MGLNLNNIYQRPYIVRDGRGLVKKKQDDDAKKSLTQTEQEQKALNNSRSRGLEYVENARENLSYNNVTPSQSQRAQQLYGQNSRIVTPSQASSIEGRSSKINIAQILKDFKNTAVAIGTPADLSEEVNNRISLIQAQLAQPNPDINLVKSDLMNASRQLDRYISKTLNKDSKVVENWVNALFLQDIDFKYNEKDINPQFLVKFPEGSTEEPQKTKSKTLPENVSEIEVSSGIVENPDTAENTAETQTKVYIPQDKELKSLFLQSKKLAYANEPQKAIELDHLTGC